MATSITIKENETLAILNELKKRGRATSFDLADATGINRDRVKLIMQRAIIPTYPEATSEPRHGYFWTEQKKAPIPAVERYAEPKNSEGYMDTTASRAIKNVSRDEYTPGDIWVLREYQGGREPLFLVLACDSKTKSVCGWNVMPIDQWFNEFTDVPVTIKGKPHYVRPSRITSRRSQQLERSRDAISDKELLQIKMKLAVFLGVQTGEKIVEKTVEVPVEVTKEVPVVKEVRVEVPDEKSKKKIDELKQAVEDLETELELANQRADIWEKAFVTACGKGV